MDINKVNEEIVRKKHMVAFDLELCKEYKKTHDSCLGCDSEIGCAKVISLGVLALQSMLYNPNSLDDHMKMQEHHGKKMKEIMDAETSDELKEII